MSGYFSIETDIASARMKPDTDYSLRPATEEDLSKVVEIEKRVHIAPWQESHFSSELSKPYCQFLVLTDDETDSLIAGYIVCWMMAEECQVLNIAVDLPFRRLGFASLMIRKCIQLAESKGINKITLEVRKSNAAAVQLYQSLNFNILHIRKGFYSNGEDAYHMSLSLDEVAF